MQWHWVPGRILWIAGLIITGVLYVAPASAQPPPLPPQPPRLPMIGLTNPETGAIFYSDNDDWWPDTGTDKNYTNGFRLTITRNSDPLNLRRFRIFRWIPDRPGCHVAMSNQTCVNTAFHFGQQFYTPDDITISELIPRDRPYRAGSMSADRGRPRTKTRR